VGAVKVSIKVSARVYVDIAKGDGMVDEYGPVGMPVSPRRWPRLDSGLAGYALIYLDHQSQVAGSERMEVI